MAWLERWFGKTQEPARALYDAVVRRGRAEHWYLDGRVPDTIDGRFDMIATVLSVALLRIEAEEGAGDGAGDGTRKASLGVQLTERFVDDMDAQLREIGIGDIVVGKHVGRMMAVLGGGLGALRGAGDGVALDGALVRNLYRGDDPGPGALAHVRGALLDWRGVLEATPLARLAEGRIDGA
jgi:cytochrome b pre-mRNA-processing protein 3